MRTQYGLKYNLSHFEKCFLAIFRKAAGEKQKVKKGKETRLVQ